MSIEDKVRGYVLENYLFTSDPTALKDGDSFMDKGIIDSTGVLELIAFLEEEFGFQILDEETVPENLDSVINIGKFVRSKQVSAA